MKINILSLFCWTIILVNCSFQLSSNNFSSVHDLLIQSKWTNTQNLEDIDLDGNFTEFGRDCEKDDSWTFNLDGTLLQEPGVQLCDSPEEEGANSNNTTAGWHLENNDQFLVFDFDMDETKFLINKCDEHELVLTLYNADTPDVYKYRIILSR